MNSEIARDAARRSIAQLSRSERGLAAMRDMLAMLDNQGIGLDELNQAALIQLMQAAWVCPGSVRDAMRDAVGCEA